MTEHGWVVAGLGVALAAHFVWAVLLTVRLQRIARRVLRGASREADAELQRWPGPVIIDRAPGAEFAVRLFHGNRERGVGHGRTLYGAVEAALVSVQLGGADGSE